MTFDPKLVPRDANSADASEVIRLVRAMWEDFNANVVENDWESNFKEFFREHLHTNDYRVLVVDDPESSGRLIACGIGLIYDVTPAFWIPDGRMGYLQWFYTEPKWRKRGIGSEIMTRFMDWFRELRVHRVQLHSHPPAVSLYSRFDFKDSEFPNMWWAAPQS